MQATRQLERGAARDQAFWFLGALTFVKSTGETTGGAFGLIEQLVPAGFASPYHVHHREDEAFYVLEGVVAFVLDGKWVKAGPGSYVFGPRQVPHGFRIEGAQPARILLLCAPAGFEHFVMEISEPAAEAALPQLSSPPDMPKLIALAAKYEIDILGPLPETTDVVPLQATTDSEAIESVRAAHVTALNAGDAEAWVGVFADGAIQMPPNAPPNAGRASIRAWAQAFLRAFKVQFALSVTELHVSGGTAFETGAYAITLTPDNGAAIQDVGKYITIYQRLPTGDWAIARDIWNSDQPLRLMR